MPYANGNANMAYTIDEDGFESSSISERMEKKKNKDKKVAADFFGVPKDVREASKRQYKAGSPGAEPYTKKDMDLIRNYYKKQQKKGKA